MKKNFDNLNNVLVLLLLLAVSIRIFIFFSNKGAVRSVADVQIENKFMPGNSAKEVELKSSKNLQKIPRTLTEGCVVAGCSGELCVERGSKVVAPRVCKPNLASQCYKKFAKCTVKTDGSCGWKPSDQYKKCLFDFSPKIRK